MINETKILFNGQELKIPNEIKELMKMFIPPQMRPQEQPKKPQEPQVDPQKESSLPRKIICRDVMLRKVVIDLNRRIMELEQKLEKKKIKKVIPKVKVKKDIKQKKSSVKKRISKIKKVNKK